LELYATEYVEHIYNNSKCKKILIENTEAGHI